MPYPLGHREAVRTKIIESARRLFNRDGFDNVSVKEIMSGAGLTHGGFYDYFSAKSDLYTEVLGCFFTDPNWKPRWEGIDVDTGARDLAQQIIRAYLSRQHLEDIENSCPMVALPTDVRRSSKAVKGAFEAVFVAMADMLARDMNAAPPTRQARAQAIAALCVGGLIVARALRSNAVAQEVRESCLSVALELVRA